MISGQVGGKSFEATMVGKLTLNFPGLFSPRVLAPYPIGKSNLFSAKLRRGVFFDNSGRTVLWNKSAFIDSSFSTGITTELKRELPRELSLDALAKELGNFSQEEIVYPSPKLVRFWRNTATP